MWSFIPVWSLRYYYKNSQSDACDIFSKTQRKSFQKLHFGQKEKPFTLKQEKSTRKVDWKQKKANILGLVLMTKMLPSSTFLSFGLFFQHLIVVPKMKYEQEQVLWKKWQQTTVELSWKDLHSQNVAKKSKIERYYLYQNIFVIALL